MEFIEWDYAPDAQYWCGNVFFKYENGRWYCRFSERNARWGRTLYASPENFSWWGEKIDRPKTEQIAAEEREAAIEEMLAQVKDFASGARRVVADLYDADYRKQKDN